MARQIDGLTTRVNLLEARIHWQEEPPEKATTNKIVVPCLNGTLTAEQKRQLISSEASLECHDPAHPIR